MAKKDISFEASLAGLEKSVAALKSDNTSLDEALKSFEEGMEFYVKCKNHLKIADEKIKIYDKLKQELSVFDD